MNLLIFGAGASYGSDYGAPLPPLGDKLLDALIIFAPDPWGRLPKKYQDACRADFEQGMQLLFEEQSLSLAPLQRAMAAYFFRFQPKITNLYRRLGNLIKLSKWHLKGSLVTFNYERLLEISLCNEGLRPVIGYPREPNDIELCVPHGCCHIFLDSIRGSGFLFTASNIGIDGGRIRVIPDPIEFNLRIANDVYPPIMSYFEPHKRTTSGQSFIDDERKRYAELVLSSTKIGIVGLKVRPFDSHIWDPLANTQAEIVYCAGERGATEFSSWAEQNRESKKDKVLHGYFSDCFETICSELDIM
jgi:hypothetical protein